MTTAAPLTSNKFTRRPAAAARTVYGSNNLSPRLSLLQTMHTKKKHKQYVVYTVEYDTVSIINYVA